MEDTLLNRGIFKFLSNRGCSIHEMRRILSLYGKAIGQNRPKRARISWYCLISEKAQEDFVNFKKIYNKNKPKKIFQAYEDWWDDCNLDGTFAYNGITDDF